MKSKRKALLLWASVVILAAVSVFGTLAYFTDSEAVVNTFTVGSVGITMDEAKVDELGVPQGDTRWVPTAEDPMQEYHLIPGYTYTKDPTIYVSKNSSDCYLFVKVENGLAGLVNSIPTRMNELGWKKVEGVDGVDNLYVFAKEAKNDKYILHAGAEVVVFDSFAVDGATVNNDKIAAYQNKTITVTGYAVQAAGFESASPADIWNATFGAQQ